MSLFTFIMHCIVSTIVVAFEINICLSICLSVCLFVCLSIYLSIYTDRSQTPPLGRCYDFKCWKYVQLLIPVCPSVRLRRQNTCVVNRVRPSNVNVRGSRHMNVDLILKVQGGLYVVSIIGIGLDQRSFSTPGQVSAGMIGRVNHLGAEPGIHCRSTQPEPSFRR